MTRPQLAAVPDMPAHPTIAVPGPFAVSFSIPIPEKEAKKAARPALPYDDYFNAYEQAAKDGFQPHFFIPCSFYHGRPGVKEEKLNPSYVRSKVREKFREWQKADEKRETLYLTIVPRDGKDEGSMAMAQMLDIKAEPGASVWMQTGIDPAA